MIDPRSYYRVVSILAITLNLVVGIGSIFLVERLVPAIDDILSENAYSVGASVAMHEAISLSQKGEFWESLSEAESNITMKEEQKVVADIISLGQKFWAGERGSRALLSKKITELSIMNLKAMDEKDKKARLLGLSGAWALGFFVVFSICLQLILRSRITEGLMEPISELISVIRDYYNGNSIRRFNSVNAAKEIKEGGELLNRILDQAMTPREPK